MNDRRWYLSILAVLLLVGCSPHPDRSLPEDMVDQSRADQARLERLAAEEPDLADGPEKRVRHPHPMTLSDLHRKYPSTFVLQGPPDRREVALTFDDAPDAVYTPMVLDALKKAGVKATFFVVGNRVEKYPYILKRIIREGHIVGNHSYNHANLPKLSDAEFRKQIQRTDEIIRKHTGYTPKLVRPPYGNVNENQIKWLASQGKKVINWNVDSLDWKGLDAERVSVNVLANIKPGAIVLQHSAGGKGEDLTGTVQAIPNIVHRLQGDKVKLVTVPELLDISSGVKKVSND